MINDQSINTNDNQKLFQPTLHTDTHVNDDNKSDSCSYHSANSTERVMRFDAMPFIPNADFHCEEDDI